MSRIEFELPEWEYGRIELNGEFIIYDRDHPAAFVQSDTTVEVTQ